MKEKQQIKISLATYIITLIAMTVIIGILIIYALQNKKTETTILLNNSSSEVADIKIEEKDKENIAKVEKEASNYFILYNGCEMKIETGVQDIANIELSEKTQNKYNTIYYNYEDGKYLGETEGKLEETYENEAVVNNVKRIAISQKYNAIPRRYTETDELPQQLMEMAECSSVKIQAIDLDGDNKTEYIVNYTVDYKKGEIGDGEPEASSGIMLMDSNYKKIADLVTLENGFWGNIKEEDRKIFTSLKDVDYLDIDNDGIMEIIIKVPTYEGTMLSVVKYNNGNVEGKTDVKANVQP